MLFFAVILDEKEEEEEEYQSPSASKFPKCKRESTQRRLDITDYYYNFRPSVPPSG